MDNDALASTAWHCDARKRYLGSAHWCLFARAAQVRAAARTLQRERWKRTSAHFALCVALVLLFSGGDLVAYYPGLLMSLNLLSEFNDLYHCPTAVELPSLNYRHPRTGALVRMVIVGDPAQPGPNLMDGGPRSNCKLKLAAQPSKHQSRLDTGKIAVCSSLLELRVKPDLTLRPADELTFSYETDSHPTFWSSLPVNEEHCATCFSRRADDADNLLIQCEGAGGTCRVSRHRTCMMPVPSLPSINAARFFCPIHLFHAALPAPQSSVTRGCSSEIDELWECFSPTKMGVHSIPRPRPPAAARSSRLPASPDFALYFANDSPPQAAPPDPSSRSHPPSSLAARLNGTSTPAPRSHLQRRAATSSIAAVSRPPVHNLPLDQPRPRLEVLKQVYVSMDHDQGLEMNCAFLATTRIQSSIAGAGQGMAGQRATPIGEVVGYMFGYFTTRETWEIIRAGGAEAAALCDTNPEMKRHVEMARAGVWWCLETPMVCDSYEEYLLLVSPQCPMGYINDPQDKRRVNVEMRAPGTCVESSTGVLDYWLLPLYSTRPLLPMEELFLDYGWTASDWEQAKQAARSAHIHDQADPDVDRDVSPGSSDPSVSSFDSEDEIASRGPTRRAGALGSVRQRAALPSLDSDNERSTATLPIRTKEAVQKLSAYHENIVLFGNIGPLLRSSIIAEVDRYKGNWFAPAKKQLDTKRDALVIPSAGHVSSNSTDLWCKLDQIGQDFAEYKSCCGSNDKVCSLLTQMLPAQRNTHSSASLLSLMKARLKVRAAVLSRNQFSSWVQSQLDNSVQSRIAWQGGDICCSCFRAVIGVSRSSMHAWRNKPNKDEQRLLELTSSGHLRRSKSALKQELATAAVRQYLKHFGQSIPNPRGKNPDEERVVVPANGQAQLLDQVHRFYEGNNPDSPPPFGRSTLARALKTMRDETGVIVCAGKSKMICRCNDCDYLDRQLEEVPSGDAGKKRRLELRVQKERHLAEVMEQRKHFDGLKQQAIASPLQLWVLAFDGMDQAKTQLPSRIRFTKGTDGLPRLGVHAVGAFMFGGPVPVMGLLNYEDLRKDSSLSVTTVMNVIDRQWQALMKAAGAERDQPDSDSGAGSTSEGQDSDAMDERDDEDELYERPQSDGRRARAKRRAARVVTPAMLQYAASRWPERLHLTFDNAVGEAKNQYMFRFLGLLVLFNIFHTITVSTLLVGHTHDIVDQMFSVWARILRVNNAATYEAMRTLFREKYHSKIQGLVALMRGGKRGDPDIEAAAVALSDQTVDDAIEARATEDDDVSVNMLAAAELERFASELKLDQGVKPVITLQTFNVNIKAWLARAKQPRANEQPGGGDELPGADEQSLKNVHVPHVYGVEKDEAGDVWLYNKFLVHSDKVADDGVTHHYPKQKTGSYSTRILLHKASNAACFNFDPDIWPARPVNAESLKLTFNAFELNKSITEQEKTRLVRVLEMFKRRQRKQLSKCATCKELLKRVHDIGVVSRRPTGTEAEKAEAAAKSTKRTQAQKALEAHLEEPHATLHKKTNGWFTQWTTVRAPLIGASYVERGIVLAAELRDIPYHIHPRHLCEGKGEKPVMEAHGRVDLRCLTQRGPPQKDQLIVVRAAAVNEAFWIGRIVSIAGRLTRCPPQPLAPNFWGGVLENELDAKYAEESRRRWNGKDRPFEIRMSRVVPTELNQPTQLGAFAARDISAAEFLDFYSSCIMDKSAVRADENSHVRRANNVDLVLDGGPLARCFTRYTAKDRVGLAEMRELPASAFLPTREELGNLQFSRFLQMPVGCMINSPRCSGRQANVSMSGRLELGAVISHAGVAVITAMRDLRKGEELLGWYHSEEERNIQKRNDSDADSEMRPAYSAAAASSSVAPAAAAASFPSERDDDAAYSPGFGRVHVSDRNAFIMQMEDLPSVTVRWLDIHPDDYQRLQLDVNVQSNQKYWTDLHSKHAAKSGAASAAAAAAAAAAAGAAAASSSSDRITKPAWLVNLFEGTRYSERYAAKDLELTAVSPSSFIFWGEPSAILTQQHKLSKAVWELVQEDLTEKQQPLRNSSRRSTKQPVKPRQAKHQRKSPAPAAVAEAANVVLEATAGTRRNRSSRAAAATATAALANQAASDSEASSSNEEASSSSESEASCSGRSGSSSESSWDSHAPLTDLIDQAAAGAASHQVPAPDSSEESAAPATLPRGSTRARTSNKRTTAKPKPKQKRKPSGSPAHNSRPKRSG
jgi:hypothetical protein